MMKIRFAAVFSICLLLLCGCAVNETANEPAEKYVFAMDTEMTLKAYGKNAEKALETAENEIKALDASLARGSAESEIYRINAEHGGEVTDATAELIQTALGISERTNGAFDITIAPIMDMWGFYTREFSVPDKAELDAVLPAVNYRNIEIDRNKVTIKNGSTLDLGGIAKGYLSTEIMDIMKENGIKSGIISLGGNVHTLGTKPDGSKWRVAVQDPFDTDSVVCVLSISDCAVITSGGYQRFFERDGVLYHHIIDPKTGFPAENGLKSVSIVTNDGALADGMSTALFVMGRSAAVDYLKAHDEFDAVLIDDDGNILITKGISDCIECPVGYEIIK